MNSSESCLVIIVLAIGGYILLVFMNRRAFLQRLYAARDAYQAALAELKANPTNPDIKQKTLELGRIYSAVTRQNKTVTLFDEMALSNDINAATAAATVAAPAAAPIAAAVDRPTAEERLSKLNDLRLRGVISEAEYTEKRQKILDEM